jgi:predicted nucleotidyltransferase component of viral defense system
MNAANPLPIALHEDVALFREALRFTAAETGFISRLIEKDYFCTLVLQYLCESDTALVFKGGTCLAKVHAGFYRLSEDLDFSISMSTESARSARSRAAD